VWQDVGKWGEEREIIVEGDMWVLLKMRGKEEWKCKERGEKGE
jgi:hypothetical protein